MNAFSIFRTPEPVGKGFSPSNVIEIILNTAAQNQIVIIQNPRGCKNLFTFQIQGKDLITDKCNAGKAQYQCKRYLYVSCPIGT